MTITGSCLCKSVTYEVTGPFKVVGHCHCSICRKAHGAAFATWGIIDAAQFRWTAGQDLVASYKSSAGRDRCFCSKCGSPLCAGHDGQVTEVVVGTLDADPGVRPSEHIFVGSKAPWHEITDGLCQHDEWPPGMAP